MKCNKCKKEFNKKEVYWHNYKQIGFFCKQCFREVVKETKSETKIYYDK
jgi:hypothetical protein